MHKLYKIMIISLLFFQFIFTGNYTVSANNYTVSVKGKNILLNGKIVKLLGFRCSNGLISEKKTEELIKNLDIFKAHGLNTMSVFFMGSRFGDVKGYNPDSTLNAVYAVRMAKIIKAFDERGMIVIVGCLYWGTSEAKADLIHWEQKDANLAVYNTVKWLKENNFQNVIVDPDNEGMAHKKEGWSISDMIDAGHNSNPDCIIGFNHRSRAPKNADLLLHHSKEDKKRPYVDSEATPYGAGPLSYWGAYSKETHRKTGYYNYCRIGRYDESMKNKHKKDTIEAVKEKSGYIFASTWLQCGAAEGINGPNMSFGGMAVGNWDEDPITMVQKDGGVRWWAEFVKDNYGAWVPPAPNSMLKH